MLRGQIPRGCKKSPLGVYKLRCPLGKRIQMSWVLLPTPSSIHKTLTASV